MNILIGNCKDKLKEIESNTVDSIVTDPPYELGFMGKKWDASGIAFDKEVWKECLRVLKPGGHLLAFSGTRTQHRMVCAIEDAGFEIRDQIGWAYGSGFPKSLDVSKAIDKAAGAKRIKVPATGGLHANRNLNDDDWSKIGVASPVMDGPEPTTPEARQWQGWGTALKPAWEPICVARKPLDKNTVAANVLEWGTGAINIDGCRVDYKGEIPNIGGRAKHTRGEGYGFQAQGESAVANTQGRWPANLIHDGSEEVVGLFPSDGDKTAARFFYCAKASKRDRDDGLEGFSLGNNMRVNGPRENEEAKYATLRANTHPTVKPTALMAYLCRLVTPKGGTVLDPFMGSGSTGRGAVLEDCEFIGIELSEEYAKIAEARIKAAMKTKIEELEAQLKLL